MSQKTRVAVLGGGPAGVTAAYELTATAELRKRYEVTVYQMGWRLGGKCASGRNRDHHDRIEEHGLHVWFGFYDNAFRLMQRVYDELDRPEDAPLATWRDAFKPSGEVVIYEHYDERWIPRRLNFPVNPSTPGDADDHSPWDVLHDALAAVAGRWAELVETVGVPLARPVVGMLDKGVSLVAEVIDDDDAGSAHHLSLVGGVIDKCRDLLWELVVKHRVDDDELRNGFMLLDFVASVVVGIADDDLLDRGWSVVNDEDLIDWLRRHGAKEVTLEHSPFIIGIYDGAFAYVDGDKTKPSLAAGKAIQDFIRALFFYKGSFLWKMQAGMGDTVFAPMYAVLRERGVRFAFFHEVKSLGLAEDGGTIETIEMLRQLDVERGDYDPLYDVGGLPCWPTAPDWSQIVDGDALAAKGVRLEFDRNPLGRKPTTLRCGEDFDHVVLAIPVQVHPEICAELIEADPDYRAMVENSACVMTQAIQTWSNRDLRSLGWEFDENMLTSTYVEPLDTYCNMSHLIEREGWTEADGVRDIAYFCGCLPHKGLRSQDEADARVHANAQTFLSRDVHTLWPDATGEGGRGFDWAQLVGPDGAKGRDRLDAQFWRANFELTERYVLTLPGSLEYRRWPHESGFENLTFAGDWTRNGIDGGSVESSVTSGMLAAQAICGAPRDIAGLHGWLADSGPERLAAAAGASG